MKIKHIVGLGSKILKAKFFKSKIPLKVTCYITYRCNLECPFCNRRTLRSVEMNTAQIKEMMKEFKEMGTYFWVFNGGEPLLREDLPELIDYAKALDFHCSVVTNGVLLAQILEKEPSFKKIDFVQISLQGPKEIHDKMSGQGNHERIMQVLNILKTLNIRTNILTLIAKDNIDYFDYLIELVTWYNITIAFQPLVIKVEDNLELAREHFPQKNRFKEAIEKLINRKKARAPIISSFKYLKMIKDYWPDASHRIHCYASQFYCNVTPDGYVVPCCAKLAQTESKSFGLEVGFKKAFRQLEGSSKCQDCYYFGPQELNLILRMQPTEIFRIFKKTNLR